MLVTPSIPSNYTKLLASSRNIAPSLVITNPLQISHCSLSDSLHATGFIPHNHLHFFLHHHYNRQGTFFRPGHFILLASPVKVCQERS